MQFLSEDETSQDCESVFDDELIDDQAATRVSIEPRRDASSIAGSLLGSNARRFRPEHVRVGELLAGKYRVERIHRRGALGLTLEALHTQLGQRVALRLLAADPHAYPEAAARFLRGARLAVQFQNEHTARITDIGTLESGAPFVVTELLSGSDLERVLRVRDLLPVTEAVDYLLQACEGLAEAHARDIVHRNLKPTNLFLTRRGAARRLVVLDFGVSEDPLSDAAINLGGTQRALKSLAYLAPEQIREPGTVDTRADIWALGVLLHEMLAGSPLYEAETTPALLAMIAAEPAIPLSHLRPDVPAELEAVVLRCVEKERSERYASIVELANALLPFASLEGHACVLRIAKALGRRASKTLPPPLPGQRTRAIVRVSRPLPVTKSAEMPRVGRRWVELLVTAAALATAGALGVFVAVHMMEGALAAALAPRPVVASLSPALPAPVVTVTASAFASQAPRSEPNAPIRTVAARPAPQPRPVGAALPVMAALPAPHSVSKAPLSERTVIADAQPVASKPASGPGLFDDAN